MYVFCLDSGRVTGFLNNNLSSTKAVGPKQRAARRQRLTFARTRQSRESHSVFDSSKSDGSPVRPSSSLLKTGALLLASASLLSACASSELKETVGRIDAMEKEIYAPPPPPPDNGKALGPEKLIATAQYRGKDFLSARISRAQAVLDLDAKKSRRYPRISGEARSISTYTGSSGESTTVSNAVLGVNWDVSKALLRLDGDEVSVAGQLIPVQYQIAQRGALSKLVDTYSDYTNLDFKRQDVGLKTKALACDADNLEVEVALGNSSPSELEALKSQIDASQREVAAVVNAMDSKRDELLDLAGFSPGGYEIAPALSPLDALSGYPPANAKSADACFANSGKKVLEDLLVQAANAQLDTAQKSRLTKLTTSIPSFMTQTGGFNLQFLVSYVLPIIDQGDSLRLTQNARLAMLQAILTARDSRRSFMSDYNRLRVDLASAQSDLAAARSGVAQAETALNSGDPMTRCDMDVDLEKARKKLAAAQYKIAALQSKLVLMCAPLSEKTVDTISVSKPDDGEE